MGKYRISAFILALILLLSFTAGCTDGGTDDTADDTSDKAETVIDTAVSEDGEEEEYEAVDISISVMMGPTGIGMALLMEQSENGESYNNYNFTVNSDVSQVVSDMINGTYDIACVPTNSAAVLYTKTEGEVQLLAINTLGVLYLLQNTEDGEAITEVSQLEGETIYTFGQGANTEYVLDYILEENGLTVGEDVYIEFYSSAEEVVALAAAGECEFAMLPEPNVTVVMSKNSGFERVLDITEEWNTLTGGEGDLVMGCIVVSTSFAEENPEAVAKFLEEYEASISYVNENPEEASELIAEFGIVASASVALSAIPRCHMVFIAGEDMYDTIIGYYQMLYAANPQSLGGSIPDEDFYYIG